MKRAQQDADAEPEAVQQKIEGEDTVGTDIDSDGGAGEYDDPSDEDLDDGDHGPAVDGTSVPWELLRASTRTKKPTLSLTQLPAVTRQMERLALLTGDGASARRMRIEQMATLGAVATGAIELPLQPVAALTATTRPINKAYRGSARNVHMAEERAAREAEKAAKAEERAAAREAEKAAREAEYAARMAASRQHLDEVAAERAVATANVVTHYQGYELILSSATNSGYKSVYWIPARACFFASRRVAGKLVHDGRFPTAVQAAVAIAKAAREMETPALAQKAQSEVELAARPLCVIADWEDSQKEAFRVAFAAAEKKWRLIEMALPFRAHADATKDPGSYLKYAAKKMKLI